MLLQGLELDLYLLSYPFSVLVSYEMFLFDFIHKRVVSLNAKHLFKYAGLDVDK